MSRPLARIAGWLVAPAPVASLDVGLRGEDAPAGAGAEPPGGAPEVSRRRILRRRGSPPGAAPRDLALLAPAAAAPALGAALALKSTGGVAVLGVWTGHDSLTRSAPAAFRTPGARRLAVSLEARGLRASAAGRLVTVALPPGEADSAAAARRLLAVDVPVVLAVGGPRAGAWDDLLREFPLVLVHAPDAALETLTIARLAEQDIAAAPLDATPGPLARSFARAGLALPGGPAIPEPVR